MTSNNLILLNSNNLETRAAIIENNLVTEVHFERSSISNIVGNIYRGTVVRFLPGMQAAFIDIGLDKAAFLHIGNKNDNISAGDKLLVQVIKDAFGNKGPRVTQQISISSRYLVYMPFEDQVVVSLKITDEHERNRLIDLIDQHDFPGGYIIRTSAEGIDSLNKDQKNLYKTWDKVVKNVDQGCIYQDFPLAIRVIRDIYNTNVNKICIDSPKMLLEVKQFINDFLPDNNHILIELYTEDRCIFDIYNVDDEIEKCLQRKVPLKSGGYLIFDQTEAMTTIDINTGGFVGYKDLEDTIYKTNMEAVSVIARQIRLRNIGGIIILDLIDMSDANHIDQVVSKLHKELEADPAKTMISEISVLGLIEMSRMRVRDSLERSLCEDCTTCHSRGSIKSRETVSMEIYRELLRRSETNKTLMVMASQLVIDNLLEKYMKHIESDIQTKVKLQVESVYTQDQYDVVEM